MGIVGLLTAAAQLIAVISPDRWLGIAAWLLGALLVHDGFIAFAVLGFSVLVRRLETPVPFAVILIIQGAVVVALIVTALVVPAAIKQTLGSANPSILPLDYTGNLAIFSAAVAAGTLLLVGGYQILRVRRPQTGSTSNS